MGLAGGVRQLSLGQGVQSSFCFVDGSCRQSGTLQVAEGTVLDERTISQEGGEEGPPGLACQLVLRAPGDGMLTEYVSCVSRCLRTTLAWLEWDPPGGSTTACMVAPGGGASEISLHLLFRDLASHHPTPGGEGHPSCNGDGGGLEEAESRRLRVEGGPPLVPPSKVEDKLPDDKQSTATGRIDVGDAIKRKTADTLADRVKAAWEVVGGGEGGDRGVRLAFSVLAAALAVVPRVLLQNASAVSHSSKPSHSERQGGATTEFPSLVRLVHTFKSFHAKHGRSSMGLVLRPARDATGLVGDEPFSRGTKPQEKEAMASLSCALEAGIVHPLAVKYGMLVALLDALISSLRVGEVVNCRGRLRLLPVGGGDSEEYCSSGEDE